MRANMKNKIIIEGARENNLKPEFRK